jgi:hypothetical protein
MDLTVPTLIEQIRVESEKMANSEGAAVLHAIELAKLYGVLRGSVTGRRWEKSLAELGISPRVAARYLKISASWWGSRTPGSEIRSLLPCDLHKLEWICRLSEAALPVFVKALKCKDVSRGEVIAAVQKLLGEQPGSPARHDSVTVQQLRRAWSQNIKGLLAVAEDLTELDAVERQQVCEEVLAEFARVEQAFRAAAEGEPEEDPGEGAAPAGQEGGEADNNGSA